VIRRRFLLGAAALLTAPYGAYATPVVSSSFRLQLLNAHTGATFNGIYRDAKGPIQRVMDELCVFLRDTHSGGMIQMDVGVIDFLAKVMAATGQTRATVLSAFRSLETNEMLARTSFGVADNSQHIHGRALDVHFDKELPEAMAAARSMKLGGVGWYPHSGFIHLDTGRVRNWDIDSGGLEELLVASPARAVSAPKGKMLVDGPGRIIVGGGKAPVVLSGRVSLKVH
jgi:uncharacterized protein YcbK (DUF882 family)